MHFIFIFPIVWGLVSAISIDDCPKNIARENLKVFGNSCYQFEIQTNKYHNDAEDFCEKNGGHLVTIKTRQVNEFILKEIQKYRYSFWIGLKYDNQDKVYRWPDNSVMTKHNFYYEGTQTYDCFGILPDNGKWRSYPCLNSVFFGEHHHFICEYPVRSTVTTPPKTPAPTVSSITVDDCPSSLPRDKYLKVYGDQCYRFVVAEQKDFDDAKQYCRKEGGNLAIVNSEGINQFIQNEVHTNLGYSISNFWIGLHYESNHREFYWVDGSKMEYTNFLRNHLSILDDDCIAMNSRTGKWDAFQCASGLFISAHHRFVCQYPPAHPPIQQCPAHLKRDKYLQVYGNYCYKFETQTRAYYDDAEKTCERDGGTLAVVKSHKVNTFIADQMSSKYGVRNTYVWIGLHYDSNTGHMIWEDGTRPGFENFDQIYLYEREQCAALDPVKSTWKVLECEDKYIWEDTANYYVCQYARHQRPTPAPTTTTSTTTETTTVSTISTVATSITKQDCPFGQAQAKNVQVRGNKCYYFDFNDQISFYKANSFCKEHGGTLAVVKSRATNDFLYEQLVHEYNLQHDSDSLWIGLYYSYLKGNYYWVDGTKAHYLNMKNPLLIKFECMAITPSTGEWAEFECHDEIKQKGFICEFEPKSMTTTTPQPTTTTTTPEPTTTTTTPEPTTTTTTPEPATPTTTQEPTTTTTTTQPTTTTTQEPTTTTTQEPTTTTTTTPEPTTTTITTTTTPEPTTTTTTPEPTTTTPKPTTTTTTTQEPTTTTTTPEPTTTTTTPEPTTTTTTPEPTTTTTTPEPTTTTPKPTTTTTTTQEPTTTTTTPEPTTTTTTPEPTTTTTTPAPTTTTPEPTTTTTTTQEPTTTTTTPEPTTTTTTPEPTTTTTTPAPTTTTTTPAPTTTTPEPTTTTTTTQEPTTTTTTQEPTTTTTTPQPTTTTTTTMTTTTEEVAQTTQKCRSIVCTLECGMDGYKTNPDTGCMICECDS